MDPAPLFCDVDEAWAAVLGNASDEQLLGFARDDQTPVDVLVRLPLWIRQNSPPRLDALWQAILAHPALTTDHLDSVLHHDLGFDWHTSSWRPLSASVAEALVENPVVPLWAATDPHWPARLSNISLTCLCLTEVVVRAWADYLMTCLCHVKPIDAPPVSQLHATCLKVGRGDVISIWDQRFSSR